MRLARLIRESAVESALVRAVRRMGGWAYKWVSPQHRGVPDRIVLKGLSDALDHFYLWGGYRDRDVAEEDLRALLALVIEFVELKAPGKEPTLQQLREHARLRRLGFKVSVIDGLAAVNLWADANGA